MLVLDGLADVAEALRSHGEVDEYAELPEPGRLSGYDLVVAAREPVWPAVLRAGVALVHHMPGEQNRLLPAVKHPLVRNTASVEEVLQVATRLKVDGVFAGNPTGEPVEHFLYLGDDSAGRVLSAVVEAVPVAPREARAGGAPIPAPAGRASPTGRWRTSGPACGARAPSPSSAPISATSREWRCPS